MAQVSTAPASTDAQQEARERSNIDIFTYDERIVRLFVYATVLWGFIGMAVGALIALQLPSTSANHSRSAGCGRCIPAR